MTKRLSLRSAKTLVWAALPGAIIGIPVGGVIGNALYTQPKATPGSYFVDFGGLAWIFWGAVIGFLAGAIVSLLVLSALRRHRL